MPILGILAFVGFYVYMATDNMKHIRNAELSWGERLSALALTLFGGVMAVALAVWFFV